MKAGTGIAVGLALTLAASGGYWLGQRPSAVHAPTASPVVAAPEGGAKK